MLKLKKVIDSKYFKRNSPDRRDSRRVRRNLTISTRQKSKYKKHIKNSTIKSQIRQIKLFMN